MPFQDTFGLSTEPKEWTHITGQVNEILGESGVETGVCHVWNLGSTGAVVVNEHDEPLLQDIVDLLERVAPSAAEYKHPRNSFSHQWASLLGHGKTVPVQGGGLHLSTWQEILFLECDHRPRDRTIQVTVQGE